MQAAVHYQAFWVPGLDEDKVDPDDALEVAFAWLREAERQYGGTGVLVMNAALMRGNRPALASAPWEIVSPRTQRPRGQGPVLGVWPVERTLELAESMAFRAALCVIPGSLFAIAPWIRRTRATCLVEGFEVAAMTNLPAEVVESLDHMLFFGGHNSFLGGGEKEDAIRRLREIARRPDAPTREETEEHIRSQGATDADGAERIGRWYDEVRQGRRHRDYSGRTI